MNWAILATGTIAAKFAETVNGMKGHGLSVTKVSVLNA